MSKFLVISIFFWYSIKPIFSLDWSIDDKIEDCNNGSKRYLDISGLKLEIVSDNETVVNGKMIMTKKIDRPWQTGFYGERYNRGEWNVMLRKKVDDFCSEILNPAQL